MWERRTSIVVIGDTVDTMAGQEVKEQSSLSSTLVTLLSGSPVTMTTTSVWQLLVLVSKLVVKIPVTTFL